MMAYFGIKNRQSKVKPFVVSLSNHERLKSVAIVAD